MDSIEISQSVSRELASEIRNMPDARDELKKILLAEADTSAHPMTNVLDMLAGIAEEMSELEGDRYEQIAQAVQKCATYCEHMTKEPVKAYRPLSEAIQDARERAADMRSAK